MVQSILFDLGGILLNLDTNRTVEAFNRLGWKEADWEELSRGGYMLFKNLETGLEDPVIFREKIRHKLPGKLSDFEIDSAWNAMLLGFPEGIADYLRSLGKKYRIYLLSNTNEIHLKRFRELFYHSFGYQLDDLFVKTYYSHEIGFRKPDPDAYRKVLSDACLEPSTTLFVDDMAINTVAAASLGLQVFHCLPGTLLECLPAYLQKNNEK
jgi:putative hydrolase of the HAD superfamily